MEAWRWALAWQQSAWAGLDPRGAGRWWQQHRLQILLDQVLPRSPLYARRRPPDRASLAAWEPVHKAELMAGFDDWATDRRITLDAARAWMVSESAVQKPWLDRYLLWTSSGTSGEPALFVQDAASLAAYDAIDGLRLRAGASLPLPLWGMQRRFAYVGALGRRYAGHVSLSRVAALGSMAPTLRLISVLEPLEEIARQLQQQRTQVLITYPSCASALARLQLDGQMALKFDEIWLGGEQLGAVQRRQLQQAFDVPLRNSYGASEFFSIACECPEGRLHLNADWVILEPVDAQGRAVREGDWGERCWLTHLANFTQPLLRYELGDRIRFQPEPCACRSAWPVIEVQGRCSEVLRLPAGVEGQSVTVMPLALETLFEQGAEISDYQLLRRADGALELRLPAGTSTELKSRCEQLLRDWLRQLGAAPLRLLRGRGPPQADPRSGKLHRLIDHGARHET